LGAKEIQEKAMSFFAEYGYERTSLALICDDIGIKKQSVYSHFQSKQDLFQIILEQVILEEKDFVTAFFSRQEPPLLLLKEFIMIIKERFLSSDDAGAKFLLRNTFMPPIEFKDSVLSKSLLYFIHMEDVITTIFECHGVSSKTARQNALAFITILDGLLTALIYDGETRFQKKLDASWRLFEPVILHTT